MSYLIDTNVISELAVDSLLAATAFHHHLRLVTRDTADFEIDGLQTVNLWVAGG